MSKKKTKKNGNSSTPITAVSKNAAAAQTAEAKTTEAKTSDVKAKEAKPAEAKTTDAPKEKGVKGFLKRKDIEISLKRYGIDALGAMAQGLFCSLLIGTIINTIGTQFHIGFLTETVATVAGVEYTVGGLASAMSGPAMAVAIAHALKCPPLVLFSMITVGFAASLPCWLLRFTTHHSPCREAFINLRRLILSIPLICEACFSFLVT